MKKLLRKEIRLYSKDNKILKNLSKRINKSESEILRDLIQAMS